MKPETKHRIAFASPLDVRRLASAFDLQTMDGSPPPEGHGGHSVTELILAVRSMVEQLDLVTLDPNLNHPVELRGEGIRLAVGPFRPRARTRAKDLFAAERRFIADRLRSWRPAVVSAQWTYEYALGSLDSQIPTLVTVRDWAPTIFRYQHDQYRAARWLMQRLAFHRASHFAAVSPYMAAKVERTVGQKVDVLPNVLNPLWFQRPADAVPRPQQVLALNNGFGARKNVRTLLRAWTSVLDAIPDAQLALVGTDYEPSGRAHRWSKQAGLDEGVLFLGPQPRSSVAELMNRSSAFVHPSREESFGMVVLEAMASATPVIGGIRSGAVPWLLGGDAGVLVDVESPGEMAGAIMSLLEDPSAARTIGERGRSRAEQTFAAEPVAAAYVRALGHIEGVS